MVAKIQSGTRLLALNRGNRTGTVMSRTGTLSIKTVWTMMDRWTDEVDTQLRTWYESTVGIVPFASLGWLIRSTW